MANRAASKRREVRLDYASDRLFAIKLQQAYELLVPDRVRHSQGRRRSTGGEDRSAPVFQPDNGGVTRTIQTPERPVRFSY